MNNSIPDIILLCVSAIAATYIFWKISPYLWGKKKGATTLEHIVQTHNELREEKRRQFLLNTTVKQAKRIHLVNAGLLFGFLYSASRFQLLDLPFMLAVYIGIGMLITARLRMIPVEQFNGLAWNNRVWLRLYYSWLWPWHLIKYAVIKK